MLQHISIIIREPSVPC